MGEVSRVKGNASTTPPALNLAVVQAPIALCTARGVLRAATAPALELLRRAGVVEDELDCVPLELWRLLERTAMGEAVEWRCPSTPSEVLGCTRYTAAPGDYVLLMREVSAKRLTLAERLQRQRDEATERLLASIARDMRSAVASVAYGVDFLKVGDGGGDEARSDALCDIAKASSELQHTLDAVLDFARLGPAVAAPVALRDVLNRALSSLRAHYGDGAHRLRMDVAPRAEWVRGNPLVIEQIFVHLLLNAVEASVAPRCVIVTAFPALQPLSPNVGAKPAVCVRVWDDGPGIPRELRRFVFDPFFTTKQGSSGLGLAEARRAVESLDGRLELTDDDTGTCFSLFLPGCEEAP